jgi:hypothetical protein
VDVAGPVQEIKDLPGLRDGTEQWVVTALPLLLAIKADRRALGVSAGAQHRAIEVEGYPAKLESLEAVEDEVASKLLKPLDGLGADRTEGSAEGSDIRESLETEQAQDHGIVTIVGSLTQSSISKQTVKDQGQELESEIIGRIGLDVPKTGSKSISDLEIVEEDLEEKQAGEGTESLVGELELGQSSGFTLDLFSGKLHDGDLSWLVCVFLCFADYTRKVSPFISF